MTSEKALKEITSEIHSRLDNIALHVESRHRYRQEFESYIGADCDPSSASNTPLNRVSKRVENEDIRALYELVHLQDNVKKYLSITGTDPSEVDFVDKFRGFRVAANFVNTHKHGIRGRNAKAAKIDYHWIVFAQNGAEPTINDRIRDSIAMINFEGQLHGIHQLVMDVIAIWRLFFKYHTKLEIEAFDKRIDEHLATLSKLSRYSAKIPQGVLDDAKRVSLGRKALNI
jgi:hypothetical protein